MRGPGESADPQRSNSTLGYAAFRGSLWLAVINVVSKGSQGLVGVALAVFLTPSQLGIATIATTILNIGQVAQSLGVYDVIARTRHPAKHFAGTIATLSVSTAAVLLVIIALSADRVADWVSVDAARYVRVMALALPFMGYGSVQFALMHRQLDFRRRLWPDAGSALLGATTTIAACALGVNEWSVVLGVLATAVSQPILGMVVGLSVPLTWDRRAALEALRWARIVGPAALIGVAVLNIDYIVVSRVLGEAATGTYSLAYRIAFIPYIVVAITLGAVAFPVYTSIARAAAGADIHDAFERFLHAAVVITGGLYLMFALNADRVVLLSSQWERAGDVLRFLCLWGFMMTLLLTVYVAIRALGSPLCCLVGEAVHLVLLGVSLVVFTPALGIRGAGLAHVVAISLVLPMMVFWLVHIGGTDLRSIARAFIRPSIALLLSGLGCLVMRQVEWLNDPYSRIGGAIVCVSMLLFYVLALVTIDGERVRSVAVLFRRTES
jgi:O-antigen/teichoic acid export membrane protein